MPSRDQRDFIGTRSTTFPRHGPQGRGFRSGDAARATARPAPPPAVPTSRLFTSDVGVMFSVIKSDKTADFESVITRVKEALAKSTNPKTTPTSRWMASVQPLEPGTQAGCYTSGLVEPTS